MLTIRNACYVGLGAAIGETCYLAYRNKDLFKKIPDLISAPSIAKEIEDKYTSKKHVDTIFRLKFQECSSNSSNELPNIQYVFQENPNKSDFVFRYEKVPSALTNLFALHIDNAVDITGIRPEFVYSGTVDQLHDSQSLEAIKKGNYVRCESKATVYQEHPYLKASHQEVDVLISGTTDCKACYEFKNETLRDATRLAYGYSSGWLDNDHPVSATPVFDHTEEGFKEVGDLAKFSSDVLVKLITDEFTACNFYSVINIEGSYRPVGAIVVGATQYTEESVCNALQDGHMNKVLEVKKYNAKE